ncbi:MAG: putative oxidoreductase ygfF [Osedax symbiont Rs1]|nr:MAG: putative oxidoreductase ygfF [Osedax symbiont Rs1]
MSNKQKKVALITGGSRGIGRATSLLLAQNGYDLCINYLNNEQAARAVQRAVLAHGVRCELYRGDVTKEDQVLAMFEFIDQHLGHLTALVNNAALMLPQISIEQVTEARLNKIFSSNITSYFLCAREAVLRMAHKHGGDGGSIVNVSSLAALSGSPHEYLDYAASKGAIDTMTIGLAREMSREGVRVNAVRPGLIYTDMHADGGEAARVDRVKYSLPLGRGGQPEEVAQAIYWLLSEQSSFTTGDTINVAGGMN